VSLPIFATKLLVPGLPTNYFPRPRIDQSWTDRKDLRLVTITAGAGWGKTTSIAAALKKEKRRILWYSLDDADRDIGVFIAHLAHAENLTPLAESVLAEGQETTFLSALISRWRRHKPGTVLVLDDLQSLGPDSAVHQMILRLVRYLPPSCTVVLASREPITLPTTKYMSQGQVIRLKSRDLGFTRDEIGQLFEARLPNVKLDGFQLDDISRYSEGWAAGLQIFFQALPGTTRESLTETIARLGAAGPGWFSYFAEEVISGLDAALQQFLLRTAFLPSLEARLCDRVLDSKNSHHFLSELSDRNLFTFSTGNGDGFYRYHHLFREFLLSLVSKQLSIPEVDQLRMKAGKVLAQEHRWLEAVSLMCQCENKTPALALIKRRADQLWATGRFSDLESALDLLGTKAVNQNAEVLFLQGQVQNIKGRWELAETTYRLALRRKPSADRRVELKSLIAQIHMRFGKYESCLRLCRMALNSENRIKGQVKARLLGLQGVSSCALGRLEAGETYLNDAIKTCRRVRNRGAEGRNLFLLAANVHFFRGDFQLAEEAARHALEIFKDLRDRRLICHSLGVLGFVLIATGKKTEAEICSGDALRRAESLGYRNIEGYCHLNLGECSLLADDIESAQHHFGTARDIGQEVGEAALKSLSTVGLARVALKCNNRALARRQATKAYQAATEQKDLWATAQALLVLGQASLGRPGTAAKYWDQATRIFTKLGAMFELARLQLWRLGENLIPEEKLSECISDFLSQIIAGSFEFLLLDLEPRRARAILAMVSTEDLPEEELREYADVLRNRLAVDQPKPDDSISVPLKIKALGPLQVTIGKRILTRKDWKSARAFRLFCFLLVHRFHWVVRDEILEALWPEADPTKASNNLRQTIHLLRKILSPDGNCPYIQLRDDTYSLQGGAEGSYDVMDFEDALHRVQTNLRQGQQEDAVGAMEKAVELYGGPFLMESPYESYAENERDHLHLSQQRVVEKLLAVYQKQGRWEEALTLCLRVLPHHPHHDFFHEILMRAHLYFGHRKEALECYRKYEKCLLGELDLLPSDALKRLGEQAAGKQVGQSAQEEKSKRVS